MNIADQVLRTAGLMLVEPERASAPPSKETWGRDPDAIANQKAFLRGIGA